MSSTDNLKYHTNIHHYYPLSINNLTISFTGIYLLSIALPSPDSNGYPTAGVGEQGLSVGIERREEYEWIAGLSSWNVFEIKLRLFLFTKIAID
ncbi:hypothetical protein [Chryseobacterium pennae]|uniref:hypothetical protein n=1 Tax=Chryseobacterium pennae TaxID=2258962 RepID=UPI000F509648|nr:hypothetical protein [Chryseobacterium pennae]